MKATVKLNYEEQKARQQSALGIMLGMLPPSTMRLVIMFILGVTLALAGVGIILCGVLQAKPDVLVLVIGIIVTLCGLAATIGVSVSALGKHRKSVKMRRQFTGAFEELFAAVTGADSLSLDFGGGKVILTYLAGDTVIRSVSPKLRSVAVIVYEDMMEVDFTDTDFWCFKPEDFEEDGYESMRKILLNNHESYELVEKDEKGKYRLLGGEDKK